MTITKNQIASWLKLLYLLLLSNGNISAQEGARRKVVLFSWLVSMGITKQIELLIMIALWRKNASIFVLVDRKSPLIRILEAILTKVTFFSAIKFAANSNTGHYLGKADEILKEIRTLEELKQFKIEEIHHGRNALSTLIRKTRRSTVEMADPEVREKLRHALAESLRWGSISQNLLKLTLPDHVVFVEKGYSPAAELYNVCIRDGVDVVQWVSAPTSDSLILKRYGKNNEFEHPLSLSKPTIQKLSRVNFSSYEALPSKILENYNSGVWFNRQNLNEGKRIYTRDEICNKLGLRRERKIAVIFTHVFYDATFFYGDNLFDDYRQWLIETVRIAISNTELNWVIKVHPVNVWRSKQDGFPLEQLEQEVLESELGALPGHIHILESDTDILTSSLFHSIDYGITVRGTIGLELPCFGIPTITAGTGRYSGNGFTFDPKTREEYRNLLMNLHHVKPLSSHEIHLARLYAYGSFNSRYLKLTSVRCEYRDHSPYIKFGGSDIKEIGSQLEDFEKIAEFIVGSNEEDYLNLILSRKG